MNRTICSGLAIAFLSLGASAQSLGSPGRVENSFDVMLKEGDVMDLHTLDELDRTLRDRTSTRSEANVSKLDLRAPGRARKAFGDGLRFFAQKQYDKAVESFKKALLIDASFVSAHNALGCAYLALSQSKLAEQEFQTAIQLDDHLSSSFLNLGRAQLALGKVAEAQKSIERAAAIAPLDSNVSLALAYTQFLNRDYAAVIKTAELAHGRKHGGIATVHYFAAASWQAQNNLQKAAEELQTFLSEDPNSPFADQARRTLLQINAASSEPVTLASTAPVYRSDSPSVPDRGQRVLQELKEKQQIADAENSASLCSSCTMTERASGGPSDAARSVLATNAEVATSGWILRSTVNEVATFFTVTDHGKSVADLTQNELTILDDHKAPEAVLAFHNQSDLPLRLALLIDTSASVTDRISFEQDAAVDFLRQVLTGKDDLAFATGFSNSPVIVQDFTNDQKRMAAGLNQLAPVGGTAIWDAISFAANKLAQQKEPRPVARILVVISDGDDNSSSSTLKQAIEEAQRDEVCIYSVSTREDDIERTNEATGNRALKTLSELTGGVAFFPGSVSHMSRGLEALQQVIRSRYLISYRPADFHHDGKYRSIEIAAVRSGRKLKVNSRKGYFSTAREPAAATAQPARVPN